MTTGMINQEEKTEIMGGIADKTEHIDGNNCAKKKAIRPFLFN